MFIVVIEKSILIKTAFFFKLRFIVDGDKKVRYLPLHAVSSRRVDKKTTKCLVDSSAYDEHEVTLNDCILYPVSMTVYSRTQ